MKISLIRLSSLIISAGQNEFTNKSPGLNGENTVHLNRLTFTSFKSYIVRKKVI